MNQNPKVLIVDDSKLARLFVKQHIKKPYEILEAASKSECLKVLSEQPVRIILLDLFMPGVQEFELFDEIKMAHPDTPIIFLTSEDSPRTVVNAIKRGAKEYLFKGDLEKKPHLLNETLDTLLTQIQKTNLHELILEEKKEKTKTIFIPNTPQVSDVFDRGVKAVRGGLSLFIAGETGTGKGTLVQYIHNQLCPQAPLVSINCGAICQSLSESELFGHEKSAFTGAEATKKGKFELADGGILFLDEIGNMPLSIQEKLLCVVENKEIVRVGGSTPIKVEFNLISASNKQLEEAIAKGEFREDLYYRIKQFSVHMPSLRSIPQIIPAYIDYFVDLFSKQYHVSFKPDQKLYRAWLNRPWKGNLRELRNEIQTTIAMASQGEKSHNPEYLPMTHFSQLTDHLDDIEKKSVLTAIEIANGNLAKAARQLGIHRSTLQGKMRKFGITRFH